MLKIEHFEKKVMKNFFALIAHFEVKERSCNWFDWSKWCRKKHYNLKLF